MQADTFRRPARAGRAPFAPCAKINSNTRLLGAHQIWLGCDVGKGAHSCVSQTCEEILQVLIDREVWSPNFGTLLVSPW